MTSSIHSDSELLTVLLLAATNFCPPSSTRCPENSTELAEPSTDPRAQAGGESQHVGGLCKSCPEKSTVDTEMHEILLKGPAHATP